MPLQQRPQVNSGELAVSHYHPSIHHGIVHLGAAAQQQAAYGVVHRSTRKGQRAQVEQHQVGTHAHTQMPNVLAAQHLGTTARGDAQHIAGGHLGGA